MQACLRCEARLPDRARFCPACGYEQALGAVGSDTSTRAVRPDRAGRLSSAHSAVVGTAVTLASDRPAHHTHLLAPGTVVGGVYTIGGIIGEGGMGAVYRAHDSARERTVAVKVLHPNLASDAEVRRRFAREAKLMRSFSHAHVASVYDFVEDDRFLAIVMECVEGPTLTQELERWGGRMPYAEIRAIMTDVLDAMEQAHRYGAVHRDLKPDNVLLQIHRERPYPKIIDFGIAKILEGTTYTVTGALLGTCRYMAPEQVEHPATLSYPADVYSLGVTLYQLVTGRCPFEHESQFAVMMAHVREQPAPPSTLRADVPPALEALIMEALSKAPQDRPRSCVEFNERLTRALEGFRGEVAIVDAPAVMRDADGSELVLVPAGFFGMGQDRRSVYLDGFYIDRFPVTNRQFAAFLETTAYRPRVTRNFLAHWREGRVPAGLENHPVVHVSWFDAQAYATWAGKRLPTEAQWEKSARGTDGRKYPWGKLAPDATRANYGRLRMGTLPVGTQPAGASPYGVQDLAGNVWEWCEDVDSAEFYAAGPSHNPCNRFRRDDPARVRMVVRGGSFMYDAHSIRTFSRSSFEPSVGSKGIGFRCVRDV
jgi:formylglycine-generating enzyme required for sulfatase activity